jgi:cell division septal protein FtsQ
MKFDDNLNEMKVQVGNIEKEQHSLAYELLVECKKKTQRDFLVIVLVIVLLFVSNILWLWYMSQFDYSSEETIVDSGNGTATYLENSESGDINYGEN